MAVTVATSATQITLSGSGSITVDTVTTTIANAAIMEKTGAGPYVYDIKGNRELIVGSGVTLNHQGDGDTLQWTLTAEKNPVLSVNSGGILNIGDGTTSGDDVVVDFCVSRSYAAHIYLYGTVNVRGTTGHDCILKDMHRLLPYFYDSTAWTWDYVTMTLPYAATTSYPFFNNSNLMYGGTSTTNTGGDSVAAHSFTNITMSYDDKGLGMFFVSGNFASFTFNNIIIDNAYYSYEFDNFVTIKFANSTFSHSYSYNLVYGNGTYSQAGAYNTSKNDYWGGYLRNQPKMTFDTCTFHDNYNSAAAASRRGIWLIKGCLTLFKNCTFSGDSPASKMGYGVYTAAACRVLWYGTNTFTDVTTNYYWSTDTTHLHVRELTLTVKDQNGNAIPGATVLISQSEGKEFWALYTNSSGQLKDIFGDNCVFVEKEETAAATFTQWSDSISGGRYHTITVSKEGYQSWQTRVAFTADKTLTATLVPILGRRRRNLA